MIRTLALALCLAPPAGAQVAEPDGYRMEAYRAPVPDRLTGGTVIDTAAARDLWERDAAAFVDVLPRTPRPDGLPEGTIWREPAHETIPGAMWLPNTGYGEIAPATRAYFLNGLDAATGGDPDAALVLFCKADCWMSWNAARRAIAEGYTDVRWMPRGVDGWAEAGFDLEVVEARPGEP